MVVFDEVAREGEGEPKFDAETIDTLKMFMQSGQYTRDDLEFASQCSIVLGGNINTDTTKRAPADGYRHLFEPLPAELSNAGRWGFIDFCKGGRKGGPVVSYVKLLQPSNTRRSALPKVVSVDRGVGATGPAGSPAWKPGRCVLRLLEIVEEPAPAGCRGRTPPGRFRD